MWTRFAVIACILRSSSAIRSRVTTTSCGRLGGGQHQHPTTTGILHHSTHSRSRLTVTTTTCTVEVSPASSSESMLNQLTRLLLPGEGQNFGDRAALHAIKATRKLTDPQMWTHAFFFMSMFFAHRNRLLDLFILLAITTPLSLVYHYTYERPGRLAQFEGVAAKLLFIYGVIQLFYAPSPIHLLSEGVLFLATVGIFIATNLQKRWYEPWHCLMHVVPPLWATCVAVAHKPLIML